MDFFLSRKTVCNIQHAGYMIYIYVNYSTEILSLLYFLRKHVQQAMVKNTLPSASSTHLRAQLQSYVLLNVIELCLLLTQPVSRQPSLRGTWSPLSVFSSICQNKVPHASSPTPLLPCFRTFRECKGKSLPMQERKQEAGFCTPHLNAGQCAA